MNPAKITAANDDGIDSQCTSAPQRIPPLQHPAKNHLKNAFEMPGSTAIGPAALNNPTFRTMADLLNNQDIKEWLKKLPEWDLEKKHIERIFEFDDFTLAMDFVNSVAEIAEEEDHHPNIDIRYNKVRIELSTHSEGGLTDMDFEVAEKIDTLVEE
jgi:4a-hydroxytetrahydrobiopterin dehydratase